MGVSTCAKFVEIVFLTNIIDEVHISNQDNRGYHIHRPLLIEEIAQIMKERYQMTWNRYDILFALDLLSIERHDCGVVELEDERYIWVFSTDENGETKKCTGRINVIEIDDYRTFTREGLRYNTDGFMRLYEDARRVFEFVYPEVDFEESLELRREELRGEKEGADYSSRERVQIDF